jgi:hypothetical protein
VALLVMDCDTQQDQHWREYWRYMVLLVQIGLEVWIEEYLQLGMCLTYLEEKSVG